MYQRFFFAQFFPVNALRISKCVLIDQDDLRHTLRSGVHLPDKIEQKKSLIYGMPYRYSNVKFDGESISMYINAKSLLLRVSFC